MKSIESILYSIKWHICEFLAKNLPIIKHSVIFDNFLGKGFGDNPKYIAEELLKENPIWRLYWLTNDMTTPLPKGITPILRWSLRERLLARIVKFRVINTKNGLDYPKRKGQICIQTWHGDFYLKFVEGECESQLNKYYVKSSKADSVRTDIVLSGSKWQTNQLRNYFWYPETTEILECGVPRNDIFFDASEETKKEIKIKYFKNESVRILLYVPTFRDDGSTEGYKLDAEQLHQCLEETTGDKWIVVLRLHPNVASKSSFFQYNDHIINGSIIADPQEIILVSDMLITDYSSTMMDAAIMSKPVFLFTLDYEHYVKNCREIRPLFNELPFARCNSNEELFTAIRQFDNDTYQKQLEDFMNREYGSFDDGNAAKRVVKRMYELLGQGNS